MCLQNMNKETDTGHEDKVACDIDIKIKYIDRYMGKQADRQTERPI